MGKIVKIGHTGDLHEDWTALDAIVELASKNNVNVLDISGDLIDSPHADGSNANTFDGKVLRAFDEFVKSKTPNKDGKIEIGKEDVQILGRFIEDTARETYQKYIAPLKKLKDKGTEIVAIAGNHDTQHIYQILKGVASFVDLEQTVTAQGIIYGGSPNTWEVPGWWASNNVLKKIVESMAINFNLGHDLKPEDPDYKAEIERIGEGIKKVQIWKSHKDPYDKRDTGGIRGSVAVELIKRGKSIGARTSGHIHEGPYIAVVNGTPVITVGSNRHYVEADFDTEKGRYVGKINVFKLPSRYDAKKVA